MYLVIREFIVRWERAAAFEAAYGPTGTWARLFRRAPGYLGTELLTVSHGRYLTLDRWSDHAAYNSFLVAADADCDRLGTECRALTAVEREINTHRLAS